MNRKLASVILVASFTSLASLIWTGVCRGATTGKETGAVESSKQNVGHWSVYSRSREEKAGEKIAKQIEQHGNLMEDPVVSNYVNRVAQRILAASGSKQSVNVKVLLHPAFNAFAMPGGRIYLTVGLVNGVESEDELASVLAHEIGHITARHWANLQSKRLVLRAGGLALPWIVPFGGLADLGYQRATPHVMAAFTRGTEEEADSLGLKYLYRAGYDPSAFVSFLRKASNIEDQGTQRDRRHTNDHPETAGRITKAQQGIKSFPARPVKTSEDSKEFADIKGRLPTFGDGYQTTRLVFETRPKPGQQVTVIQPTIIQPKEITNFMQDETPPVLKWKDSQWADDRED
jgi:predicted Zn-dependent protease